MAEQAILEIQNLSSTAFMAIFIMGGIMYFICDIVGALISAFFTWLHKKIKENKSDNV